MGDNRLVRNVGMMLLKLGTVPYNIEVDGAENLNPNAGGVFAFKHHDNADVPYIMHALSGLFLHFPAKVGVLKIPGIGKLLELGGAYPLVRPKDTGYDPRRLSRINIGTFRSFFTIIRSGGWFAYAPEGTRVPGRIGENMHPQLLIKAEKERQRGAPVNTYLLGLQYELMPPCTPLNHVTLRFEEYRPQGSIDDVAQDMREKLAVLSGLEETVTRLK